MEALRPTVVFFQNGGTEESDLYAACRSELNFPVFQTEPESALHRKSNISSKFKCGARRRIKRNRQFKCQGSRQFDMQLGCEPEGYHVTSDGSTDFAVYNSGIVRTRRIQALCLILIDGPVLFICVVFIEIQRSFLPRHRTGPADFPTDRWLNLKPQTNHRHHINDEAANGFILGFPFTLFQDF